MNPTTALSVPHVTPAEIDQARSFLRDGEHRLAAAIAGLSDAQWQFQPAPGRWSIAGIVEHCAVVQQLILSGVREQLAAAASGPNPDAAAVDEVMRNGPNDRSVKVEAPPFLHPTGALAPATAWETLRTSNRELVEWLESGAGLRDHCIPSPPVTVLSGGRYELMDGYQWILGAAGHLVRHARQILDIRQLASFPAA